MLPKYERLVGVGVKDIAIGAGDLGSVFVPFKWNTASPTARHRCDVSVLPRCYAAEMGYSTGYELLRNTVSARKT